MLEKALFPARTLAFTGLTFTLYGMLELDTAASPKSEREAVLYKWIQRYGKGLLSLYGVDVKARGPYVEEGKRYPGTSASGKGRIFVMNHRSGLDIPITLAFVEATIVSRADLSAWPVIGVAAKRVGTLFVDRSSRNSGAAVINAMCEAVERGRGVMVYPEGTTFAGDEVRPFRAGAFSAAEKTGAEVIPIGLAYAEGGAAFVDEPMMEHMKRVSMTPKTRAALVVGEPIDTRGMSVAEMQEKARQVVQGLVNDARKALE